MKSLAACLRNFTRRPSWSAAAVTVMALGVGANAAVFSVVRGVLLQPLPYREPERLVQVLAAKPSQGIAETGLAAGDFATLRKRSRTLVNLSAYGFTRFTLTGSDRPAVIAGAQVSPSLFALLGRKALLGRTFRNDEETAGHQDVVIIDEGLWRTRFQASTDVLGQSLRLDGHLYQIVGVMPADFRFPRAETSVWTVLSLPADLDRRSHSLGVLGRLRAGTDLRQAENECQGVARTLAKDYPATDTGWSLRLIPLSELVMRNSRGALVTLSAAVGLVLVIAGANLAGLLLASGAGRRKEIAIRAALGARRSRLVALFVGEGVVLAVIGGGIGLALAGWGMKGLLAASPQILPHVGEVKVDEVVALFSLALALASGFVSSVVPALQLSRPDLETSLRRDEDLNEPSRLRLRSGLIVGETALALVLLIAAGLMVKNLLLLVRVNPGFEAKNVLAVEVALPPGKYGEDPQLTAFYEPLIERVAGLPGVRSVAAASAIPLWTVGHNILPFALDTSNPIPSLGELFASFSAVTPGFFRTLGIPLEKGRDFNAGDRAGSPPVVIVDSLLARQLAPAGSLLGRHLLITPRGDQPISCEIVGIAGAVHERALAAAPRMAIYIPFRQVPHNQMVLIVRTRTYPLKLAGAVERQILALDRDQPVGGVRSLEQQVDESEAMSRFYTVLFMIFAAIGLVLASVGLYGLVSYSVSRRQGEIAVRMALGATWAVVLGEILGASLRLASIGIALGYVVSLTVTKMLSSLLFGVDARDPEIFLSGSVLLLAVAVLASVLPAGRALRADPARALR